MGNFKYINTLLMDANGYTKMIVGQLVLQSILTKVSKKKQHSSLIDPRTCTIAIFAKFILSKKYSAGIELASNIP
jgi:hypothetical protein